MTLTVTFDLTLLYLAALNILAILGYVLLLKQRARKLDKKIAAISVVIADYFRADGVDVRVDCVARNGGRTFIAFVESEPMKRFRYSHIVENSLCVHVKRTCGLDLEHIFWRFPFTSKDQMSEAAAAVESPDQEHDDYIREGLESLKKQQGYDIREGSWDEFENTVTNRDVGQGQNPKE